MFPWVCFTREYLAFLWPGGSISKQIIQHLVEDGLVIANLIRGAKKPCVNSHNLDCRYQWRHISRLTFTTYWAANRAKFRQKWLELNCSYRSTSARDNIRYRKCGQLLDFRYHQGALGGCQLVCEGSFLHVRPFSPSIQ